MIIPNLLRAVMRKDVGLKSKLLLVMGLIYLISPVDLLPDVLVGFGWLDDLVIVPLLGWLSYRSLPDSVQREVVSETAENRTISRRLLVYLAILVIAVILITLAGETDGAMYPRV
jgi:uncharacterized membrane protein YkvA (DUF1232 family)